MAKISDSELAKIATDDDTSGRHYIMDCVSSGWMADTIFNVHCLIGIWNDETSSVNMVSFHFSIMYDSHQPTKQLADILMGISMNARFNTRSYSIHRKIIDYLLTHYEYGLKIKGRDIDLRTDVYVVKWKFTGIESKYVNEK